MGMKRIIEMIDAIADTMETASEQFHALAAELEHSTVFNRTTATELSEELTSRLTRFVEQATNDSVQEADK